MRHFYYWYITPWIRTYLLANNVWSNKTLAGDNIYTARKFDQHPNLQTHVSTQNQLLKMISENWGLGLVRFRSESVAERENVCVPQVRIVWSCGRFPVAPFPQLPNYTPFPLYSPTPWSRGHMQQISSTEYKQIREREDIGKKSER